MRYVKCIEKKHCEYVEKDREKAKKLKQNIEIKYNLRNILEKILRTH